MRASALARWAQVSPAARSAAASATRGVPLTDEHREKIREACQGKRRSAATCARIRTAKRGKKLGAAARFNL